MKGLNTFLRNLLLAGVFIVPFIPFIVADSMYFPFITGKNFAFRILVEVLFAGWLVLLFNKPEYRPRFNKLTIAVLSFLGVLTLATIFSENPYRSFWSNFERMEGLITQIHLVAYFLVLSSILSTEKLWRSFFATSLVASVGMTFFVLNQLTGGSVINQGGVRVDGTLGNATYLAVYALFHIFFAVYFLVTSNEKWQKWVYSLVGLANFFMLYKTATRGTMLGLLGGALLFGLLLAWRGKGKVKKVALSVVGVVALIVVGFIGARDTAFVQQSPVLNRFASISTTDATTESRFLIWQMSFEGFKEHPVLGWGLENYNLVFDKYYNPELWRQEPWFDRSHNVFFDWLISAGLLGLISYLSLFGLALWYIWKSEEDVVVKSLITSLLAGYFFHNIFVFDNLISYIFFFSILAWVNAMYIEDKSSDKKEVNFSFGTATDSVGYIFAGVVVLALVGNIYFVNLRPINASQELIRGLVTIQSPEVSLNHFKNVINLNTFASREAREQLLQSAIKVSARPDVSEDIKSQWLVFANEEMNQAILSGEQDDARSNLIYSGFLGQVGLLDQAIERLEVARVFSPNKQSIIMQESNIFMVKGNKEKALELAKVAFDLDPDYPEARKNYLATALYSGNDQLVKDLAAGSDDPDILLDVRFVNIYAERNQFGKVLEIWQKQVEIDPSSIQNQISLAGAYLKVGKRADAIKVLKDLIIATENPETKKQLENVITEIEAGRDPFGN